MNAKRQPTSSKETWQAIRVRYTWHLRPPLGKTFDHSHWWEGHPQPEPVAALYELARRHPVVGDMHRGVLGQSGGESAAGAVTVDCLGSIGLKIWPKLTPDERELWLDEAGNMKGVDCRDEVEQCYSIILLALGRIQVRRAIALKRKAKTKGMTNEEFGQFLAQDLIKNPPPTEAVEAAIARRAVDAYRKGDWLLAVAPDLPAEKAASLLRQNYRDHSALNWAPKQRARCENWLPLISAFEDAETADPRGAKSHLFIPYRRAVDGIRFTPDVAESVAGLRVR